MSKLQNALTDVYADEIAMLEAQAAAAPKHEFSAEFQRKMKPAFKAAERRYVHVSHFQLRRAVLVAVLIATLIISSLTAIAVMKPSLLYHIRKSAIDWSITFDQKGTVDEDAKIEYIDPECPAGFKVISRDRGPISNDISYENSKKQFINYDQSFADGQSVGLDAEDNDIHETTIFGHKAIISHKDDMHQIFFDDGTYTYDLSGNCDYKTLKNMAISVMKQFK